jgi:hypothetical protein
MPRRRRWYSYFLDIDSRLFVFVWVVMYVSLFPSASSAWKLSVQRLVKVILERILSKLLSEVARI